MHLTEFPAHDWNWQPPDNVRVVETIDLHTEGEPLRVFISGLPEIKGGTILEKRRYFKKHYDTIRTGTLWEPRGHADMYGAVLTEPVNPGSDFGTFFLHNEGYSVMCGHAIIALTKLVLDTGMLAKEGPSPEVVIDAPPGTIFARAFRENGQVKQVSFQNVPSFMAMADQRVSVPGIGEVLFDIGFGGTYYAYVSADALGLILTGDHIAQIIDWGRRIKHAVMDTIELIHPHEPDLAFLYGTIFVGESPNGHHSRNVCVFADGEVDRSPTGSGVSGRAAIHHARGELDIHKPITIESILGTTMDVRVVDTTSCGPHAAVIPEVTGTASITGRMAFYFDPEDPLKNGFILR